MRDPIDPAVVRDETLNEAIEAARRAHLRCSIVGIADVIDELEALRTSAPARPVSAPAPAPASPEGRARECNCDIDTYCPRHGARGMAAAPPLTPPPWKLEWIENFVRQTEDEIAQPSCSRERALYLEGKVFMAKHFAKSLPPAPAAPAQEER